MQYVVRDGKNKINKFTDLVAWQKAHKLALDVYKTTGKFPHNEQFGLTSQIKRAVISVTSNVAEGFSRQSKADKVHFYHMALGSCSEVQNQLIAARDLKFIDPETLKSLSQTAVEVHKLLNGLIKSVKGS